jgi:L-asparaginase
MSSTERARIIQRRAEPADSGSSSGGQPAATSAGQSAMNQPSEAGPGGDVRVPVLTTGGTISSRTGEAGRRPALSGSELTATLLPGKHFPNRVVDVLRASSYTVGVQDMQTVLAAVARELTDPDVPGVVVTHGTDTLEETAYLVDLFHDDERPVVLTGAIRPADHEDTDGPRNLAHALAVAVDVGARGRGVLVVFGGKIFPAAAVQKIHTSAREAFGSTNQAAIGLVDDAGPRFHSAPRPRSAPLLRLHGRDLARTRVDIVALYPGADEAALEAAVRAGARGVVLQGTGSGNSPAAFTAAVARLCGQGIVVALSTRVPNGLVEPLYGGSGGGHELAAAGAVPTGALRPSQARILLLALLSVHTDSDGARAAFSERVAAL